MKLKLAGLIHVHLSLKLFEDTLTYTMPHGFHVPKILLSSLQM